MVAEPDGGSGSAALVESLLEQARKRLIETGARSRLINYPVGSSRSKSLDIVDEKSDEAFRILLREGRKMKFLPGRPSESKGAGEAAEWIPPDQDVGPDGVAARHTDTKLQTRLTPEGLQSRLTALARDARSLEQEQGISALFLALGFLVWHESPAAEEVRHAPLILLPVELARDDVRSAYSLKVREDDLTANIALQERLRADFNIALPEIPDGEDWTPTSYLESVRAAVESQSRWSIEPDRIVLGFFSFAKLVMYQDLDPANWPDRAIASHPLITALLADGFAQTEPPFPDDVPLDELLQPADTIHVVDADASQARVIETVRRGANLVVQGPPGTGKSQSITNIIAAAVKDGKSVLFVAEKLAALTVVHDRLVKAGLALICLELHSRTTNKKAVLESVKHGLDSVVPDASGEAVLPALARARDRLNADAAQFNTAVGNTGLTPFQALGAQVRLAAAGQPPPRLEVPGIAEWSRETWAKAEATVADYAALIASAGLTAVHPWRGARVETLAPTDRLRLSEDLRELADTLTALEDAASKTARLLKLRAVPALAGIDRAARILTALGSRPKGADMFVSGILASTAPIRLQRLCEMGRRFQALHGEIGGWFLDAAWQADAGALREGLSAAGNVLTRFLKPRYRAADTRFRDLTKGSVPDSDAEKLARLAVLEEGQGLYRAIDGEAPFGTTLFGQHWHGTATDFGTLAATLAWLDTVRAIDPDVDRSVLTDMRVPPASLAVFGRHLGEALAKSSEGVVKCFAALGLDLQEAFGVAAVDALRCAPVRERISEWRARPDGLDDWLKLRRCEKDLRQAGLSNLIQAIAAAQLPAERAVAELRYLRAERLWKAAVRAAPGLAAADGKTRQDRVDRFRALEAERRALARTEVLASHGGTMPRGFAGEMRVLRDEIARKRGHRPVRKLVADAGRVLQQIKPVLLMSPLSVAQFIPPQSMTFDLLVIDEASQVKPEDALGAIARANQIVVVGDQKQLPPTTFFDRLVTDSNDDDDDAPAPVGEMESVLTLCEARGVKSKMLKWHYRSRHPSLIAVSNREFYSELFIPPAPVQGRTENGFFVHPVASAYDRGGTRTNVIEAQAVIVAIGRHAREHPHRSLGVATFSIEQRRLIENLLEAARRADRLLDQFAVAHPGERLFVKNLENVQGDERDAILVSVGYGPRAAGTELDSLNFGPVSRDGGERRLNVLFTRARFRCDVFVSFASGDIDTTQARSRGAEVLKQFLRFGETGSLDVLTPTGGYDSDFEEAVADAIRAMGYEVDSQVGETGFRIDLAVKHPDKPGHYMLAVECDGAAYHSAAWARERDRLRQEVLEEFGWRFHRIWSTDWFHNPEAARRQLRERLEAARAVEVAPAIVEAEVVPEPPIELLAPPPPPSVSMLAAYVEAEFSVEQSQEPHELPSWRMAEIVAEIVAVEGPVHADEIARRVARLFEKSKTGTRIVQAVMRGLQFAKRGGKLHSDGKFYQVPGAPVMARDRSNAALPLRRGDMLPPREIAAAMAIARAENGPMDDDDMVLAVARLFGFARTGPDLRDAISRVVRGHGRNGAGDTLQLPI